jgi:hypothetical protein
VPSPSCSPTSTAAGDPPALLIIVVSIAGAVGAMILQRYVIIVGTAFGGAWTLLVGALEIAANRGAVRAAASGDVWVLYPFSPGGGAPQAWTLAAWIVLGLIGLAVQLAFTGKAKRRK